MFDWLSLWYQNNFIAESHDILFAPASDMGRILYS